MLAGAVLVYLDEEKVDARKAQKVKLYIDADRTSIRMMRTDSFMFANGTHWIAAYNFKDGVPVEDGDERIIMVHVPVLFNDEKDDWDEVMRDALEGERSDFLGSLWEMELPPSGGRLYLPVLSTPLKEEVMAADRESEKPTCDTKQLLAAVVKIMRDRKLFVGNTRELLAHWAKAVGPSSPIRYATTCKRSRIVAERAIRLDLSNPKSIAIEIGDWTE